MSGAAKRSPWAPWTGVFSGAFGWFLHQQAGANANYWDCRFGGPLWTAALGVVCGAIILAGAAVSWRARRAPDEGEDRPEARAFAGLVGAVAALIFLFAMLLDVLASLTVPACA